MADNQIDETAINILAEATRIEGKVHFENVTQVHGTLVGEITAAPGSTLILKENGVIEGNIKADTLIIGGFVRGDIHAKTKVVICGSGRVIGNIRTALLTIDFGAYFEGRCSMEPSNITSTPALSAIQTI